MTLPQAKKRGEMVNNLKLSPWFFAILFYLLVENTRTLVAAGLRLRPEVALREGKEGRGEMRGSWCIKNHFLWKQLAL